MKAHNSQDAKQKAQQAKQLELDKALHEQQLRFERRYEDVIARFHKARAAHGHIRQQFQQLQRQCSATKRALYHARSSQLALRRQCQHLWTALHHKQEVIQELLPYYPYALSPELRNKLESH